MTTIRLTNLTDSLPFRSATALAHCTDLGSDDTGVLACTRRWTNLSSGEELLWRVLGWLNGDTDLPALDTLRAGLDGPNLAAVENALCAAGFNVRPMKGDVA